MIFFQQFILWKRRDSRARLLIAMKRTLPSFSHSFRTMREFALRLALTWHLRNRMWTFVLMGAIGSCIVSYTLRCFIIFIWDLFCEFSARNAKGIIALFYCRTCFIFSIKYYIVCRWMRFWSEIIVSMLFWRRNG